MLMIDKFGLSKEIIQYDLSKERAIGYRPIFTAHG